MFFSGMIKGLFRIKLTKISWPFFTMGVVLFSVRCGHRATIVVHNKRKRKLSFSQ